MNTETSQFLNASIAEIYRQCETDAPNLGVTLEQFSVSIERTIAKHLEPASDAPVTTDEIREFLDNLQAADLFLALACSVGNERAWWEFDQQHRSYMERVAKHLAKTDIDASESVDAVYVELYGTRIVDGERVSKFALYSGRGSLRGWLRTVIWHSVVDLHRAGHGEVSLDELTENIGEGAAHASFAIEERSSEDRAENELIRTRYRSATVASLSAAMSSLDAHERLLLKYYHVDGLKLREISRLAENESSPLRDWFQRRSQTRESKPDAKVHESTVMRWLEKSYGAIQQRFKDELASNHSLSPKEIELCVELASEDLHSGSLFGNLGS
jgi:RNA polymerase sigma-70 factor